MTPAERRRRLTVTREMGLSGETAMRYVYADLVEVLQQQAAREIAARRARLSSPGSLAQQMINDPAPY